MLIKVGKALSKISNSNCVPEVLAVIMVWLAYHFSSSGAKLLTIKGETITLLGSTIQLGISPEDVPLATGVLLMTLVSAMIIYVLADVPYKMQVEKQEQTRSRKQ